MRGRCHGKSKHKLNCLILHRRCTGASPSPGGRRPPMRAQTFSPRPCPTSSVQTQTGWEGRQGAWQGRNAGPAVAALCSHGVVVPAGLVLPLVQALVQLAVHAAAQRLGPPGSGLAQAALAPQTTTSTISMRRQTQQEPAQGEQAQQPVGRPRQLGRSRAWWARRS